MPPFTPMLEITNRLTQISTTEAFGDFDSNSYASHRHAKATNPPSNQQLDERPFYEVMHGPTYIQSVQDLNGSNIWHNINPSDAQQSGIASFGSYFDNDLINVPDTTFGFGGVLPSSTWVPQPTQDLFSFDFQDQPAMFGMGEAQSSAGPFDFVTAPAPAPAPVPQLNASPRHHCPMGCAKSFRRPGDYRRHMKKHDAPRYKCVVMDCDKTFYRADKLRAHLKQGHKFIL